MQYLQSGFFWGMGMPKVFMKLLNSARRACANPTSCRKDSNCALTGKPDEIVMMCFTWRTPWTHWRLIYLLTSDTVHSYPDCHSLALNYRLMATIKTRTKTWHTTILRHCERTTPDASAFIFKETWSWFSSMRGIRLLISRLLFIVIARHEAIWFTPSPFSDEIASFLAMTR